MDEIADSGVAHREKNISQSEKGWMETSRFPANGKPEAAMRLSRGFQPCLFEKRSGKYNVFFYCISIPFWSHRSASKGI